MKRTTGQWRPAGPGLRCALCGVLALSFGAGHRAEADFSTKGSIIGKVVDETNAPVSSVDVVLMSAGQGTKLEQRKTDAAGSFVFARLRPGAYQLGFLPPNGSDLVGDTFLSQDQPGPLEVQAGKVVRVVRTLKKGGRLEVSFLRASGPWVPTSCPCTFDLSSPGSGFFREPSEGDGRLIYRGLPAREDYTLSFEAEGHASEVISPITIRAGETTQLSVRYDPADTTGLAGVLRMADGTPLRDTIVYVRSLDQSDPGASAASAKTDSTGTFRIVGLRPGTYLLSAGRHLGQATVVQGTITNLDLIFDRQVVNGDLQPWRLAFLNWLSPPHLLGVVPLPAMATQAPPPPPSPPPSWPWRSTLWIGVCAPPNLPRQLPDTDSLYKKVVPEIVAGIKEGLECLRSRAPQRARKLEEYVSPSGIIPSLLRPRRRFVFACDPEGASDCAWSPSLFTGVASYFSNDQADCGCLKSVVLHELLHTTSTGYLECPTYRCTKECISCAVSVPSRKKNARGELEDCSTCAICTDAN